MNNYVNKINIAANQDKTEVVINFMQESPRFQTVADDETGDKQVLPVLESQSVADIVVTGSFAKEIAKMIDSIMNDE